MGKLTRNSKEDMEDLEKLWEDLEDLWKFCIWNKNLTYSPNMLKDSLFGC